MASAQHLSNGRWDHYTACKVSCYFSKTCNRRRMQHEYGVSFALQFHHSFMDQNVSSKSVRPRGGALGKRKSVMSNKQDSHELLLSQCFGYDQKRWRFRLRGLSYWCWQYFYLWIEEVFPRTNFMQICSCCNATGSTREMKTVSVYEGDCQLLLHMVS